MNLQISTRDRVVEQAMNMFLCDGVKSIRMDDIASALYISKRTLYELFGDKETLLIECIKSFHIKVDQEQYQATIGAKNVIEELMLALEQWELHSEHNYKIMTSLKKFYPRAYVEIQSSRHQNSNMLLKLRLERGVEQGIFLGDVDLDLAIQLFTDSLLCMVINNEKGSVAINSELQKKTFMYLIIYFFRGIATEKGIRLIEAYRVKMEFKI